MIRAVDGFDQLRQVVFRVVLIADGVGEVGAGLHILHHPVNEIVIISRGDSGGRVGDCRQCAVVVVGVADGVPGSRGTILSPYSLNLVIRQDTERPCRCAAHTPNEQFMFTQTVPCAHIYAAASSMFSMKIP